MDYSAIFPCTILFFLIYMSMVVAIEVWCHYIHSVCVWWWWLSVGKSSFSKCSSADVGVEKERVWKSVSAWINQIISWLITTLPRGGGAAAGAMGFVYALKTELSFCLCSHEPCFSARAADGFIMVCGTHLIIVPRHHLALRPHFYSTPWPACELDS